MSDTVAWVIRICIVLLLAALSLTCTMILREMKRVDVFIIEDESCAGGGFVVSVDRFDRRLALELVVDDEGLELSGVAFQEPAGHQCRRPHEPDGSRVDPLSTTDVSTDSTGGTTNPLSSSTSRLLLAHDHNTPPTSMKD